MLRSMLFLSHILELLSQQPHHPRQSIHLFLRPTDSDTKILEGAFRGVGHFPDKFRVGFAALGEVGKIDDGQVGEFRPVQPPAGLFYDFR